MTDKMRSEFEAWLKREWPKALTIKYNSGDYRSDYVQQSWVAWQASREALQIELPEHLDFDRIGFAAYDASYVEEALAASGVGIAP